MAEGKLGDMIYLTQLNDSLLNVTLSGMVDMAFDWNLIFAEHQGPVRVNMSVITFNSAGMGSWMLSTKKNLGNRVVSLHSINVTVIYWFNQVYGMIQNLNIESFFAPYKCSTNNHQMDFLIVPYLSESKVFANIPDQLCPECGEACKLYGFSTDYLEFLNEVIPR